MKKPDVVEKEGTQPEVETFDADAPKSIVGKCVFCGSELADKRAVNSLCSFCWAQKQRSEKGKEVVVVPGVHTLLMQRPIPGSRSARRAFAKAGKPEKRGRRAQKRVAKFMLGTRLGSGR